MIRHLRDTYARRRGGELSFESGFTLIELLIVIVVLGILAATVIFALSNVTSQSASAACNSDAKSYEVAVSAYENASSNANGSAPGNTNALVPNYLHTAANNPAYAIAITGDTGNSSGVNNWNGTPPLPTGAPGQVYVLDVKATSPSWTLFDSQTGSTGCYSSAV